LYESTDHTTQVTAETLVIRTNHTTQITAETLLWRLLITSPQ